ncbi:Myosin-2 [Wickerhamomyces ciferrii]|uniref:Myosin-2 n=1 Tax=Wickerhamomyces ciferrii (strain ATCC 14091 / BCRC 22168 / CBS 111 / JCM 3599 / NBRC 0793 / NRRL Y-1031 F-60-10) TaxID=1206466 RepID=K0KHI0_WICCF|nr:Myosin-2 [Wickerhamomyces ciferrii]CCH42471.1 Myosin-2 [Wickerhamomyces ciferrii]
MAYNQSFHQPVQSGLISTNSSSSNVLALGNNQSQRSSRYGELSSSGAGSWVVFAPSVEEDEDEVLSTTNEYDDDEKVNSSLDIVSEHRNKEDQDDDDDDDSDSLIDSLDTDEDLKLSLPTHDGSGNFMNTSLNNQDEDHLDIFNKDLSKEDFITNRIDNWRREQAKILIEELHQSNSSSNSLLNERSHVDELLASWGVDDRDPIDSNLDIDHKEKRTTELRTQRNTTIKDSSKPYKHGTKRFYGDDIFENYTEWEVNMIKKVAKQLSSSLIRDKRSQESNFEISTGLKSRRSSLLSNLSKNSINNYFMNTQSYFWQKDLSSAHSSISTTSIVLGNNWGDVM